ncbi:MAG: hypothetical protein U0521_26425 [Anaerolineae bacterium]
MPDLEIIQQSVLRYGDYALEGGYLSIVPRSVVFSRAVNMATIGDQLTAITFDNAYSGAGAYTDVQEDMEIEVHDGNNDAIKGRLRVAYGGATSTIIQVNEVSKGRLQVVDNDRFDVLDEFRLRDKLVGATDTFPKDSRREYVDEGEEPAPAIIVGGAPVGWLDPITGVLEVDFDASGSYSTDPDNTGGLTYLWDVADGTITVGVDTDDSITVTFDTSTTHFRHVTLTVTDADTGKTTVRKIPVWSHDEDNLPIIVTKADYGFDRTRGDWSATFTLDGDGVDIDSLRDGCFVVYWEVERYGGGTAPGLISYGNEFAGRSNVKFAGYLRRETISINPDNDTLTIEAISPLAKLGELAGFSQVLDTTTNPATWQQDERVTINKLLWYVQHYHSTFDKCHDLVVPDTDYDFPDFSIQQSTMLEQLREVAAGVSCIVLCDATGRVIIKRNLQRATTSERNAAGVTLDMAAQDLREVPNLVYEHAYQYNSVLLKMFTTAGNPMLSIAPGEAPAEAPDRSTFERGIGVDQSEANAIAGFVFAELNSLYNGIPVPKGVTLKPHAGYGVLDPAYPMWLQMTLAATTNKRGRSLNGDKFICTKVDITTDPETGLKDITWTLDHETYGYQGVTRAIEPSGDVPYIPYVPPNPTLPDPFPGMIGRGTADMALLCINGLVLTETFQAASPTWAFGSWASLSVSGTFLLWVPDGFAPGEGWVFTTTKIYRFVLATGSATLLHSWSTTILTVSADASISEEGFVVAVAYVQGSGSIAAYSTDGTTFTEIVLNTAYATDGATYVPNNGCRIDSVNPGTVYTSIYTTTGSIGSGTVVTAGRRSTDYGATWSAWSDIAANADILAQTIFTPFPLSNIVYYSRKENGACDEMRVTNGSAVSISPQISGENYSHVGARDGISASPQNRLRMIMVGEETTGGQYAGFLTNNGGDSWAVILDKGTAARHCALSGNDPSLAWAWGGSTYLVQLALSASSAVATDKSGNLASLSASSIIAIAGA